MLRTVTLLAVLLLLTIVASHGQEIDSVEPALASDEQEIDSVEPTLEENDRELYGKGVGYVAPAANVIVVERRAPLLRRPFYYNMRNMYMYNI